MGGPALPERGREVPSGPTDQGAHHQRTSSLARHRVQGRLPGRGDLELSLA